MQTHNLNEHVEPDDKLVVSFNARNDKEAEDFCGRVQQFIATMNDAQNAGLSFSDAIVYAGRRGKAEGFVDIWECECGHKNGVSPSQCSSCGRQRPSQAN